MLSNIFSTVTHIGNILLWFCVFYLTTTLLLYPTLLSHQWLLYFRLATDLHHDALPCFTDFYFCRSFCFVNNFYVCYDFSYLFVNFIFVFVNLVRVFFFVMNNVFLWWIRTSCNFFAERVFFTSVSRTIRFVIFWYFICCIFARRKFLHYYLLIDTNSPQLRIFLR